MYEITRPVFINRSRHSLSTPSRRLADQREAEALPEELLVHCLAERFVSELKPHRVCRLGVRSGDVPELVLAGRGSFVDDLSDLLGRRVRRHRLRIGDRAHYP